MVMRSLTVWLLLAGAAANAPAQVARPADGALPVMGEPATAATRLMVGPGMPADYVPPQAGEVTTRVAGDVTGAAATVTRMQTAGGSAACLVKTVTEGDQTALNVELIVPADEIETLIKAGFAEGQCKGREKQLAANRDMLCQMASDGNEAVHLRLASLLALPPQRLCDMGKTLASGKPPELSTKVDSATNSEGVR